MDLAVSAAVRSTATVESAAAAMEATIATAMEAAAATTVEAAGDVAAARETTTSAAGISVGSANISACPTNVAVTDVSAAAIANSTMAVIATPVAVAAVNRVVAAVVVVVARPVPWAGADEEAAYKPVRTVVSIGRTAIGCIPVVAIRADRRSLRVVGVLIGISVGGIGRSAIGRNTDSHTHRNLCVGFRRRRQKNTEYSQRCNVFEEPHLVTSWARNFKAGSGVMSGSHT